jgi:hypothetical protein
VNFYKERHPTGCLSCYFNGAIFSCASLKLVKTCQHYLLAGWKKLFKKANYNIRRSQAKK